MYVLDTPKPFGFIAHPKTGSRSVREAMLSIGEIRNPGSQHGLDETEIDNILKAGGVVASAVRNPYDLIVSWYYFSHAGPGLDVKVVLPFNEWVPRELFREGKGIIDMYGEMFFGIDYCNFIIRFENGIEEQLNDALDLCDLGPVSVPVIGAIPHPPYREMYDDKTRELVGSKFQSEIEEWSYSF